MCKGIISCYIWTFSICTGLTVVAILIKLHFPVFSCISRSILVHIQFVSPPLGGLGYYDLRFLRDFTIGLWLYQIACIFCILLMKIALTVEYIH